MAYIIFLSNFLSSLNFKSFFLLDVCFLGGRFSIAGCASDLWLDAHVYWADCFGDARIQELNTRLPSEVSLPVSRPLDRLVRLDRAGGPGCARRV